jgi:hypothetical protein
VTESRQLLQALSEEGKNFTYGMMGKNGFEGKRKEVEEHRRQGNQWKI